MMEAREAEVARLEAHIVACSENRKNCVAEARAIRARQK